MYLYYSGTNQKVINVEINGMFGGDESLINEMDLLEMLETAYDENQLCTELLPYGVFDVEFISPTEALLIGESHFDEYEKVRVDLMG